jgi:Icc-related predicted phosphoesterase
MRVLAITDVHAEEFVKTRLSEFLQKERFDLLIVAGDVTNRGPVSFAEDFLDSLRIKTLAVHGNMDPAGVLEALEKRGMSLHAKRIAVNGFRFAGFGGSNPTPFQTPSEYGEDAIERGLSGIVDERTVLVTHAPPHGCLDTIPSGAHVGSRSVRKVIKEKQPVLCICGHVHETEGEASIGRTLVIKVAPAMTGKAAAITLGRKIEARFVSF